MGYRAWDLLHDPDYLREDRWYWEQEDALEADEVERDEREHGRYEQAATQLPLMPRMPR